jgi:hypothetical protein
MDHPIRQISRSSLGTNIRSAELVYLSTKEPSMGNDQQNQQGGQQGGQQPNPGQQTQKPGQGGQQGGGQQKPDQR